MLQSSKKKKSSVYLVDGTEYLRCAGDPLNCPTEDVQREFQPLQNAAALTVQTQALQCLKTHNHTCTSSLRIS